MTDTARAVISTLAFFDLFDQPLSLYELYASFLGEQRNSWSAFREALDALAREGRVQITDGMVMLTDHPAVLEKRRQRQEWIAHKMKRAVRAARLLRRVPFVTAVFVCNRLAAGHPHEESDIDFFIVVRDGRLWFSRLLVTALLHIFGLRRHGTTVADQVCLSFYVTTSALGFSAIKLDGDDVYLRYWIAEILPLWSCPQVIEKFWHENVWAHGALHQAPMPCALLSRRTPWLTWIMEWMLHGNLGSWCEKHTRAWQKKRMKEKSVSHAVSSAVVITDTMLKFHENDRREWYRAEWEKRVSVILSKARLEPSRRIS